MTSSVLIPSFRCPAALRRCLDALAKQTQPPDEIFVVWQADEIPTRGVAEAEPSDMLLAMGSCMHRAGALRLVVFRGG